MRARQESVIISFPTRGEAEAVEIHETKNVLAEGLIPSYVIIHRNKVLVISMSESLDLVNIDNCW